ncbi:MAG: hypothetical protein HYY65_06815 [Candidatus Tectomicrobia bacterium]|uniref:Uncharacterized protein n=1 Tax=Tectimicrobiota bacterium TaxID=2528274 RepID=A0A932GP60_UNCTE|nr:hypothetical protein [Candidatus Tectomicrobia bacterium]
MSTQPVPEALNPDIRKRDIVVEADGETLEKMLKMGHVRGFTVMCDEGERVGGNDTAPSPLAYFTIGIGF